MERSKVGRNDSKSEKAYSCRAALPSLRIIASGEMCTLVRDEVVINRVRMGHTVLTHGYLMNDDVPDVAPH